MSVAEKLEALDAGLPRGIIPWARYGTEISIPEVDIVRWSYADLPPAQWDDADERAAAVLDPLVTLRNALPQIVAVVEAVEQLQLREFESGVWYDVYESLPAALAALEEAL